MTATIHRSDEAVRRPLSKRRKPRGQPSGSRVTGWPARIAVLLIAAAWTVPTLGLLISSFRQPNDVLTTGWWTVFASPLHFLTHATLSNYTQVLANGMGSAFINTIVVAVPATVCPVLAAAFAGYAFAWMKIPCRNLLFGSLIALMVVPAQATLIPLLQLFSHIGLTGTFYAVWIAHAGFGMPLAIYILHNYISSLPRQLIDSARIDGASDFAIFWRLVLPLSVPAIAAFTTFQFLWVWNDFLVALVFLGGSPDVQVLTLNLQTLIGSRGEDWYLLTAGAFVTMIVPMIVFLTLQRFFVRGLTAGALK